MEIVHGFCRLYRAAQYADARQTSHRIAKGAAAHKGKRKALVNFSCGGVQNGGIFVLRLKTTIVWFCAFGRPVAFNQVNCKLVLKNVNGKTSTPGTSNES